jgi:phenylacetic acid degradation protein
VAAFAFVKAGFEVRPRMLAGGIAVQLMRVLSDDEIVCKSRGTAEHQQLARRCLANLDRLEPLATPEPDRLRLEVSGYEPLCESRGSE